MFKTGDKVETSLGIGIVYGARYYTSPIYMIMFNNDNTKVVEFAASEVKSYMSAYEKLLKLGWTRVTDDEDDYNYEYHKGYKVITIDTKDKTIGVHDTTIMASYETFDLELSRILMQYLEELK